MQRSASPFRLATAVIAVMAAVLLMPPASPRLPEDRFSILLSRYRPAAEADPEIVLIEVSPDELSDGSLSILKSDFFLVLAQMGAEEALVTISGEPLSDASPLSAGQEEYLKGRFEAEFGVIRQNVGALFNAIRFGSVRPQEAAVFIEQLVVLIDKGGERLLDDMLNSESRRTGFLENAREVFGEAKVGTRPADLGYLMPEYKGAFVVPDYPRAAEDRLPYRRLPLQTISSYVELEEELHRLLEAMEEAGYLSGISPELKPTILYDHAQKLLSLLLETPQETPNRAWLDAKTRYVQSVDLLLAGKTEAELDRGFTALLKEKQEEVDSEEVPNARLEQLRRDLAEAFGESRKVFDEYMAVKILLSRELEGSSCIVGAVPDPQRENAKVWSAPTAAETAAAEVQSIWSGRYSVVLTGWKEKVLLASPGLVFAVLLGVLSVPFVLAIGILSMIGTAAVWSLIYINTGLFLYPVHAALATGAAMVATLIALLLYRIAYARICRSAGYRFPRLGRPGVSALRKAGSTSSESWRSVVLAIRSPLDLKDVLGGHGADRVAFLQEFHSVAGGEVQRYGGAVVGADGLVILAGFGTPFDKFPAGRGSAAKGHLDNALRVALNLAGSEAGTRGRWSFGLDTGDCHYYLSPANGYSIEGNPAVYARILSRLANRYEQCILMTEEAVKASGRKLPVRRLDTLVEKKSGQERLFFALLNDSGS